MFDIEKVIILMSLYLFYMYKYSSLYIYFLSFFIPYILTVLLVNYSNIYSYQNGQKSIDRPIRLGKKLDLEPYFLTSFIFESFEVQFEKNPKKYDSVHMGHE